MNRTALIFIWIVAVLVVCGLLLADIRDSEGQEVFIPDGFDLWLDDDTVLAIPGGYVRPWASQYINLALPANNNPIAIYTLADDEFLLVTGVSMQYTGTVGAWMGVGTVFNSALSYMFTVPTPITVDVFAGNVHVPIPPSGVINFYRANITAGDDIAVYMHGYQWKGVGA